jgi:iron complex outermembrane receptor protein
MKKTSFLLLLVLVYPFSVNAQFEDSVSNQGRVFQLGEVVIRGSPNDSLNTISIQSIEKINRIDISNALNVLPGISLANK